MRSRCGFRKYRLSSPCEADSSLRYRRDTAADHGYQVSIRPFRNSFFTALDLLHLFSDAKVRFVSLEQQGIFGLTSAYWQNPRSVHHRPSSLPTGVHLPPRSDQLPVPYPYLHRPSLFAEMSSAFVCRLSKRLSTMLQCPELQDSRSPETRRNDMYEPRYRTFYRKVFKLVIFL